jgi:translation initiation factor IF-3
VNLPKSNGEITAATIRLIGSDGEMVGVVDVAEGIKRAKAESLDLVEISPNAEPPVCKILNFGQYKYQAQKHAQEGKKKQKTVQIKEIKLRPNIGEHDYQVKLSNMIKFLENGDKVKVTLRFRGREMAHQDIGHDLMKRMIGDVGELGKAELEPKMDGRQMLMVIVPR